MYGRFATFATSFARRCAPFVLRASFCCAAANSSCALRVHRDFYLLKDEVASFSSRFPQDLGVGLVVMTRRVNTQAIGTSMAV